MAESDFRNIQHPGVVHSAEGDHYSEGIYGQTLPWWTNDHYDIAAATEAFVNAFKFAPKFGDAVEDCYLVQFWNAPDFRSDAKGFEASQQTVNYRNRMESVNRLLATGVLTG